MYLHICNMQITILFIQVLNEATMNDSSTSCKFGSGRAYGAVPIVDVVNEKPRFDDYHVVATANPETSSRSAYSLAPTPPVYAAPETPRSNEAFSCTAPELLSNAWYHGNLTRAASEALLAGQESFAFLVRDCQHASNKFTVSVVKLSGGIAHILVSPVMDGNRFIGFKFGEGSGDPKIYRSVRDMVDINTAVTGRMKVLGRAVPRAGAALSSASSSNTVLHPAPPHTVYESTGKLLADS
jgi:hypothetical protein